MRNWAISLLLLCSPLVQAHEKLVGAFGIPLGITVSQLKTIAKVEYGYEDHGANGYSLTPPKKNKLFSSYDVDATGNPEKVFLISATDFITGEKPCLKKMRELEHLLASKYSGDLETKDVGSRGSKNYLFALFPSQSPNFVGGGCYETNLEDNGFGGESKGFFYSEKNSIYRISINYGNSKSFQKWKGLYKPKVDDSGL